MEMRVTRWAALSNEARSSILSRSESSVDSVVQTAAEIVSDVRQRGDVALRELEKRLDGFDNAELPLRVQGSEYEAAEAALTPAVKDALEYAITNVRAVHEGQKPSELELTHVRPGILAGERTTPVESAGLYVPRGRGSFPSMLYMLAVPAVIAGVPRIAIATPPAADGSVDPACLYAARLCGVDEVYRVGGAQAVAAFAWGTESISPVDKIVGPGSAYVAAAKRVVRDFIDTGIPAGPSESAIIADESADPAGVARDLLIEAEHGADSQAVLVTNSEKLAHAVAAVVPDLVSKTPEPRRTFLRSVFEGFGMAIIADSLQEACEVVNTIAPEHLQIRTADPWDTMSLVTNAGEILIGEYSAFSLANYAAGANAVLPTGGFARTWSGVSVADFQKRSSVVRVSREAYPEIARHAMALAQYEGFHWHAEALRDRS